MVAIKNKELEERINVAKASLPAQERMCLGAVSNTWVGWYQYTYSNETYCLNETTTCPLAEIRTEGAIRICNYKRLYNDYNPPKR